MAASEFTVLHYVGYNTDAGGIVSVVRALADAGRYACVLGVNRGFKPQRIGALPFAEFPSIDGEKISLATAWRARGVAKAIRGWLAASPGRVFHGHSRAGLLVALWLWRTGERRVVVSVHCYGRQRWFYRWAGKKLAGRLYWLSPAMRTYYGADGPVANDWSRCIPGCVTLKDAPAEVRSAPVEVRSRPLRLAGIGALVPWKRWELVLDALGELPAEVRSELRFTHIGGSQASEESQRYAADLRSRTMARGLGDIVEWRGEQPSADALLRDADVLVIAADHEPFSVAMLEALSAGVPVLAADSGGARDVITPSHNGWLFRSGDGSDLARYFRALVETDALARVQIDRASLQRFSAAQVAGEWQAVYLTVV